MCGFVIYGGCELDRRWKRKVAGFLVVAIGMLCYGLLGFSCDSWDGGL